MRIESAKIFFRRSPRVLFAVTVFVAGCSQSKWDDVSGSAAGAGFGNHSLTPYIDQAILDTVNPGNARIEIDLAAQKARLFRATGSGRELALETPISTGMLGKTPRGQFRVLEKLPSKESSLYGIWVDGETGALLERNGDSRSRPPASRAQFMGSSMPYWLRVTPDGVGMHVGYVSRNPVSQGCIRVPQAAQILIFERVAVGTPVTIVL